MVVALAAPDGFQGASGAVPPNLLAEGGAAANARGTATVAAGGSIVGPGLGGAAGGEATPSSWSMRSSSAACVCATVRS